MEFMLLFIERRDSQEEAPEGFAQMHKYAGELADRGTLRRGAPLVDESQAARVRVRDGKALVSDGPYAETKEVLGGFWIVDVASRAEAIEIARTSPHAAYGIVEVHPVLWRRTYEHSGSGTPFLFAFHREQGLTDPDGSKLQEMLDFSESLQRDGRILETAPLARDQSIARIETRGGKRIETDGPFAETKEGVGGYGLVRAADRDEAVAIAKRYPHAKWGPVEVREILFFDRTRPKY